MRHIGAAIWVASSFALNGCGSSEWRPFRIDVDAVVDGKPVSAHTIWRTRLVDSMLNEGHASTKVRGNALILPVAPGHDVYGLFATMTGDTVVDWSLLPAIIDGVVLKNDQDKHTNFITRSPSKYRAYAANKSGSNKIEICTPRKVQASVTNRCQLFIYFNNAGNPQTAAQIKPDEPTHIGGHTVVIKHVFVSYDSDSGGSDPGSPRSEFASAPPQSKLGAVKVRTEDSSQYELHANSFGR